MIRRPPRSTPFPDTTLFRSLVSPAAQDATAFTLTVTAPAHEAGLTASASVALAVSVREVAHAPPLGARPVSVSQTTPAPLPNPLPIRAPPFHHHHTPANVPN